MPRQHDSYNLYLQIKRMREAIEQALDEAIRRDTAEPEYEDICDLADEGGEA